MTQSQVDKGIRVHQVFMEILSNILIIKNYIKNKNSNSFGKEIKFEFDY